MGSFPVCFIPFPFCLRIGDSIIELDQSNRYRKENDNGCRICYVMIDDFISNV